MSTKIYEAYRIPLNKMGETLLFFKAQFMKSAIEEAKKLSTSLKEEYIQKGIDSFKSEWTGTSLSDEDIKKRVRIALALSLLIRSSKKRGQLFAILILSSRCLSMTSMLIFGRLARLRETLAV